MRFLVLVLSLLLLINYTQAFPLTGSNGVVNATVYGVSEGKSINGESIVYYIDMSADERDYYSVVLVDSEDIAHGNAQTNDGLPNFNSMSGSKYDKIHAYNGAFRDTLEIPVSEGTIIKRLKITPGSSDPFSIDWNGVPETTEDGIKLQFYSGKSEYSGDGKYTWIFDLKVTNLRNETLTLPSFSMKDSTGWVYKGTNARDKLLADESLRFLVTFQDIGASSRPTELICDLSPMLTFEDIPKIQAGEMEDPTMTKYGKLSMDISSWV